jgi:hypothetical protein
VKIEIPVPTSRLGKNQDSHPVRVGTEKREELIFLLLIVNLDRLNDGLRRRRRKKLLRMRMVNVG